MSQLLRVLVGLVALASTAAPSLHGAAPTADELARALQKRYDSIRDFSADFEHSYTGGVLRKRLVERGRLFIKKPGRMRWEYSAPEKKTFVADGVRIYSYIPADQQVIVTAAPPPGQTTTPALFLAGQGDLARDFIVSDAPVPNGLQMGTRSLKLTPKVAQPEFEFLILSVDPATLALRGLASEDTQGGTSSFVFVNLKENVGTSDNTFVFTIPRGVDVVTDDPDARTRREGASGR